MNFYWSTSLSINRNCGCRHLDVYKRQEYAYRQLSGEKAPTFHKLLFVHAEDTSAGVLLSLIHILIASTFLCSLCTFVQSYWNQSVQQEIAAYGDWDAQLLEIHAGQLDLIRNNRCV